MMMRELWILLLVSMLLVAAQTGGDGDEMLPQTVESENELSRLSAHYPEAWFAETVEDGYVLISSNEALLDPDAETLPEAGEIRLTLMTLPRTALLVSHGYTRRTAEEGLQSVLGSFMQLTIRANGRTAYAPPESITIEDRPALLTTASVDEGDGLLLLVDYADENSLLLVYATAASGTIGEYIEQIQNIAAAVEIEVLPPDPEQTEEAP